MLLEVLVVFFGVCVWWGWWVWWLGGGVFVVGKFLGWYWLIWVVGVDWMGVCLVVWLLVCVVGVFLFWRIFLWGDCEMVVDFFCEIENWCDVWVGCVGLWVDEFGCVVWNF